MGTKVGERALGPGQGEAHALFGAGTRGGILGALVESHADVGTESDLHVDGMFGGKEVGTSVEVGAEADAIVGDFAERAEGENLEASGVGEEGARPTDETMQAAHAPDDFVAGPQVEVIRVAEDDFGAERFKDLVGDGFDRSLRADRHEDWCLDGLMREDDLRTAAAGGGFVDQV
ncbi:MAG TPA: hypothetical protein VMI93_11475, partial [Candidatus Solibacter sp.]|nr:hypothetical protein [Candidatus Solibacter sp.]